MKATELKSEGLKKEFKIVIPAKDFEQKVDDKLNEVSKNVKLPGFRPGKAPKAMLKQKYKASVMGEVVDEAVRSATEELIKDKKLRPAMMPDVKITAFGEGKDLEFEVSLEELPEIKAGDFSKIELEKLTAEVPAEEVDKALQYLAQSRRETVKIDEDRASQKGDTAVIDFVGSVDGVEFQGGKGNAYPLQLGSGSFIPGFEDQLVGKKARRESRRQGYFPRELPCQGLAGKDAVLPLTLKNCAKPKTLKSTTSLPSLWAKRALILLNRRFPTGLKAIMKPLPA